jgi:hypothetical protein
MLLFACVVCLAGFPFCIHALTSLGDEVSCPRARVKSPIIKHVLNIFLIPEPNWAIFVSLLHKQTGSLQMFFQHHKYRNITENWGRGWVIICFQSFEIKINALDHFLVPAPISSSFLVCFECLQTWWVCQLGFTKLLVF